MKWMEMLREGGDWLAAARNWIKWNVPGGDHVTWGSGDVLTKQFRVRDIEELAAHVAADAERAAVAKCISDLRSAALLLHDATVSSSFKSAANYLESKAGAR